ncbi:MAG: hypothetical protein O2960_06060 [Verrucomicrobia bacterium]|nr:hypothetical protein [Verrucomicrobiota bacterium]
MRTDPPLTAAGETAPILVSLGGATLREALNSPCGTGVLRIGAVETPDCLDVLVFQLCLLVRVIRRKDTHGSTEFRPTEWQGAASRI